jgi:hypothetical protein
MDQYQQMILLPTKNILVSNMLKHVVIDSMKNV